MSGPTAVTITLALLIGWAGSDATALAGIPAPSEAEVLQRESWRRAADAFRLGRYQQAEYLFREAVRENTEWGWAHMMLGITLSRLEKNREAIGELLLAIRYVAEDTERFQTYLALARIYLAEQDYASAISYGEDASPYALLRPEREALARVLGPAHYASRQWAAAIDHLLTTLDAQPDDARARGLLSYCYLALDRYADAILHGEQSSEALLDDPAEAARVYFALALAHTGLGDWDKAVAEYRRSTELDPENIDTTQARFILLLGAEEAIRSLREAVDRRGANR
jgi:tetratricopeptide (TPR) repeat protein